MSNYDDFSKTFSNSRINMKWGELEYFIKFIKDNGLLESKPKILDIGCGNGRLLDYLGQLDKKFDYLGIDSSSGMIDEARKLHPNNDFGVLDMLDIKSNKDKFDMIFFIASFHHLKTIEDRINVLSDIKEKLKGGGHVFMTNWNLFSQENKKRYREEIEGSGDFQIKIGNYKRYYHGFTQIELEELFKDIGFDIVENRILDNGRNIISILKIK